jgi:hypothetical protein
LLWTGDRLIVAWTDLLDLKWRAFDQSLSPLNDEQKLATSGAIESSVALARVRNGWGAAFRAGDRGLETIEVRAEGVAWSTPPELPGPTGDRPTLVELDSEHLLVLFTIGTDQNVGRLRAALLSFSAPGPVTSAVFARELEPYAADATLTMRRPSAVRAGDDVYVAWEGESENSDPLADEVFLARVRRDPQGASQLSEELLFRLPHDSARTGPQRNARVATSPLFPGGALITTWEDESRNPPRAGAELMLDFRPVPFVMLPSTDR